MNKLDQIISFFSPRTGLERARYRAASKTMKRSYDGATKGRRGDGWNSNPTNQNIDIQKSLVTLRERMIHGYKNDSNVFRAIRTIQNNVIGTGIMPTPIALPGEAKLTKAEISTIKKYWEIFVENSDFDGFFDFYGLQSLAMRTAAMQGECFWYRQRDTSGEIPFKLQILAPHMICHTKNGVLLDMKRADNYVVQGVEFDSRGRRVGFWIYEYNPNNEFVLKLAPKFVPIEDVKQMFYKEYPEQVRGIPFGTAALLNMRDLADYEDAQLMLQKVAACHVAFTTKPADPDDDSMSSADHMEPGLIEHLAPGEEVTFNNPPTPSSYSEYVSKNQQKNATGFGITYEQMSGDLSNVNFSSGRMGWIEGQKQVEDWQYNMFIPQSCKPIWNWFIDALIFKGVISRRVGAEWTPPGREMLDPVKELNGIILELKSGLISWTEACKRRGYNPDALMLQIKTDKEMFKNAGVNVEWIIADDLSAADPASGKGEPGTVTSEELKRLLDAYGVGVRAGTITPTPEDETYFRNLAQFPEMGDAVVGAWKEDGGFRRPNTLAVAKDNEDFVQ